MKGFMVENEIYLSIVTPTYNRARLLSGCYASLCRQPDFDFEWIIVDDGSTDETEETVRGFEQEKFPIIYVKKPNGGKHTALNAAHGHMRGKYTLILDSDDRLTDDAAALIKSEWSRWDEERSVGIVTFLKGGAVNEPNCVVAEWSTPADIMRCRRKCLRSSDCCEVIRTELFKKYPFPVFEGERFLAEGALWNRVSLESRCVYINRVIYICEYLEDGLTKSGRAMRIRNPLGGMYNAKLCMNRNNYFASRVKNALLYVCYGFFAGKTPREMAEECGSRALMRACLPFGWAIYIYWKRRYGEKRELSDETDFDDRS